VCTIAAGGGYEGKQQERTLGSRASQDTFRFPACNSGWQRQPRARQPAATDVAASSSPSVGGIAKSRATAVARNISGFHGVIWAERARASAAHQ
jgi:hypothetical protein